MDIGVVRFRVMNGMIKTADRLLVSQPPVAFDRAVRRIIGCQLATFARGNAPEHVVIEQQRTPFAMDLKPEGESVVLQLLA